MLHRSKPSTSEMFMIMYLFQEIITVAWMEIDWWLSKLQTSSTPSDWQGFSLTWGGHKNLSWRAKGFWKMQLCLQRAPRIDSLHGCKKTPLLKRLLVSNCKQGKEPVPSSQYLGTDVGWNEFAFCILPPHLFLICFIQKVMTIMKLLDKARTSKS